MMSVVQNMYTFFLVINTSSRDVHQMGKSNNSNDSFFCSREWEYIVNIPDNASGDGTERTSVTVLDSH